MLSGGSASNPNESLIGGNSQPNNSTQEREEHSYKNEKSCGEDDEREGERSARLIARAPGVSTPNRSTLLSAVAIINRGKAPAAQVEVREISVTGAKRTSAAPVSLGRIGENELGFVDADFSGGPFEPGKVYPLLLAGTYSVGGEKGRRCEFRLTVPLRVPPSAPGSAPAKTVKIEPKKVSGGNYPPQKPKFDIEVNRSEWTVPRGPFVAVKRTPTSTGTKKAPIGDPPAINFVSNESLNVGGSSDCGTQRQRQRRRNVFASANWLAAFSTQCRNRLYAAESHHYLPQVSAVGLLLRPDRAVCAKHQPFHLAPAGQRGAPGGRQSHRGEEQQRHRLDLLGPAADFSAPTALTILTWLWATSICT